MSFFFHHIPSTVVHELVLFQRVNSIRTMLLSYLIERGSDTLLGPSLSLQCNYIQHFQNSLFESFFYLLISRCFREIFNKKQMNYSQRLDIRMEMASELLL